MRRVFPVLGKILGIASGAAAALGATGFVGYRLVERRRQAGGIRAADSIQAHFDWWREQRSQPGELLYVAIGDSAAQGIGAARPGRSYVGLLADHMRRVTGRSVRVVNLSISGARVADALAKQLPHVAGLRPDVMTVSIGANDIGTHFDPARFEQQIEHLYSALPPHAIVADVPSFYLGARERQARAAAAIVRRIAARHALLVAPLHRATRRVGAPWYVMRQVAADFFHPNDRGYSVWASAFFAQVDRRIAERDSGLA
jgi:acyl-CoA thioesterase-1